MLYNDEGLPEDNVFNKMASEFKSKFNESFSQNNETLKEEQNNEILNENIKFNETLKELFLLLSQNEVFLTQIKNVLKKTRYRVSAYMASIEDALIKTQNHKNKLISVNPSLSNNVFSEQKQFRFYNAKASILNYCNNSSDILKLLLFLMLIKNLQLSVQEISEIAEEQVDILKLVINLL